MMHVMTSIQPLMEKEQKHRDTAENGTHIVFCLCIRLPGTDTGGVIYGSAVFYSEQKAENRPQTAAASDFHIPVHRACTFLLHRL